jgi:hypothetical protein
LDKVNDVRSSKAAEKLRQQEVGAAKEGTAALQRIADGVEALVPDAGSPGEALKMIEAKLAELQRNVEQLTSPPKLQYKAHYASKVLSKPNVAVELEASNSIPPGDIRVTARIAGQSRAELIEGFLIQPGDNYAIRAEQPGGKELEFKFNPGQSSFIAFCIVATAPCEIEVSWDRGPDEPKRVPIE